MKVTSNSSTNDLNVLADFTTNEVVIEASPIEYRTNPAAAMKMARELMRAAFTLGYQEPEPEHFLTDIGKESIALGPQSVTAPESGVFNQRAVKLLTELKTALRDEMSRRLMRTADPEVAIVQYLTNPAQAVDGLFGPNTHRYAFNWIRNRARGGGACGSR